MHGLSYLMNKRRKRCWDNQILKAVPLSDIRNITIITVRVKYLFKLHESNIGHKFYICTKYCDKNVTHK
jgi:hypothetical protein